MFGPKIFLYCSIGETGEMTSPADDFGVKTAIVFSHLEPMIWGSVIEQLIYAGFENGIASQTEANAISQDSPLGKKMVSGKFVVKICPCIAPFIESTIIRKLIFIQKHE